jgi:uncharacterized protein
MPRKNESHPNERLLRAAYGLRNEGEVASFGDFLHADIVWHASGGDLHGRDEVLAMLGRSDEIAGGTTSRDVHALFADDDYGMVMTTIHAERDGRAWQDRQVHVFRFVDGRVAEFWEFIGDRRAYDDFWSVPKG